MADEQMSSVVGRHTVDMPGGIAATAVSAVPRAISSGSVEDDPWSFFRPFEPSPRERDQPGAPVADDRPQRGPDDRGRWTFAGRGRRRQSGATAIRPDIDRITFRRRLRATALELNPWHICAGHPVLPALVFAGLALLQSATFLSFFFFLPESSALSGTNPQSAALVNGVIGLGGGAINQLGGIGLGYAADRGWVRRITLLRAGVMVSRLAALGMGFAGSTLAFTTFFLVSYIGIYVTQPAQSILGDVYPIDVRQRVQYFNGKMQQAGQVLALPLMGLISLALGWQWSVAVLGVVGLVVGLAVFGVREPARGEADLVEAGAAAGTRLEQRAVGVAESVRTLWSMRSIRLLYLAGATAGMGGGGIIAYSFLYFSTRFGVEPAQRGLLLGAIPALVTFTLLTAQGGMVARLSSQRPGRLLTVVGLLLLLLIPVDLLLVASPVLVAAVALYAAVYALFQLSTPAILGALLAVLPPRVRSIGIEAPITVGLLLQIPNQVYFRGGLGFATAFLVGIDPSMAQGAFIVLPLPWLVIAAVSLFASGRFLDDDIRTMIATTAAEAQSREASQAGRSKIIVCRDVDVRYGAARIISGVDFDVVEGEIVALLGTNGAGKSTLLRAISGLQHPSAGAIFYDGEDITHLSPNRLAARGVVMVPGGRAVFATLTVHENLRVAARLHSHGTTEDAIVEPVLEMFPALRKRADTQAGDLSGGEQQMLALGQALTARPRLLMIDELSLGLAPQIVEQLLETVRRIRDQGTTVLLVEQSVNVALAVATRAVFMDRGRIEFDGPVAGLYERRDILRSVFLAESRRDVGATSVTHHDAEPVGEPVLLVRDVALSYGGVEALKGVGFELQPRQVVGIVGSNGAGKTTLFDVVSGFAAADRGTVQLGREDVTHLSPDARARLGLTRSFQNVNLFGSLTVRDNILVAMEKALESRSTIAALLGLPQYRSSERRAGRRVDGLIESLGLERFANKFMNELSTGSRRIVDLACILATAPQVLLLDEPSSGLAQAEVEELGPVIRRIIKETEAGVVLIEHDLSLVRAVSDRVICMHVGEVIAQGEPDEVLGDPAVITALVGRTTLGERSGSVAAG